MAKPIEARIFLNTILGRMSRLLGCTTLLIVEKMGSEKGPGMEEFVADGVINLETVVDGLEIRRRLLIPKMRGSSHSLKYQNMVIGKNGLLVTGITRGRRGRTKPEAAVVPDGLIATAHIGSYRRYVCEPTVLFKQGWRQERSAEEE
jgi:KaiC/GvpD/RAD55 family RecA-like ATPase